MSIKNERQGRSEQFAKIWSRSRAQAGKTQEFMAEGLGVSKKTIQNWENGVTAPDLFTGSEWFRVLGVNPLPYYLDFLFPEMFEKHPSEQDDDVIEDTLIELIRNMTAVEKRELLYLMAGQHGSPWYSLLQMFTAHCHTSMQSRVNAARLILENYEMDCAAGADVCSEDIQPDTGFLANAVDEGKNAVLKHAEGYTNVRF